MPDPRYPYVVGAVKIAYEDRDVAHSVITPDDDRGFFNIIGAEDDVDAESVLPVGENVTYRVELTEAEAAQFAEATNCRYVELDTVEYDTVGAVSTPAASSMRFMRADFPRADLFHGRDVLIGLLDGGTTTAVRNYLGVTMVARQVFNTDQPGTDETTSAHGCLVAGQLFPTGGKFLDAIVSNNDGSRNVSNSAAAARWCADQGAKVVNYSGSGTSPSSAWTDALQYLKDRGVEFFASAGNDGLNQLGYPAAYSTTFSNCHSSISFDEQTGARSTFSNYDNTGSGCAPGTNVIGFTPAGVPTPCSGTSMSSPHMALLCAMGCTGNKYTPAQVGAALKANTRNTGQPAEEQGAGAYDLEAALTALGALTGLPAQTLRRNLNPNPSFEVNTTGYLVESVRTGITATQIGRSTTIATPFGTGYASTNVTGDGTASTTDPDVEISLPAVTVTAGQAYTFSVHSRHTVAGASLEWAVEWQNASGTTLSTAKGGRQPLLTSVWARYRFTATAPTGATKAVLWLLGSGFVDAVARSWRWDGFQYEQTPSLKTYFDGSTSGGAWTGTAHNSTSTIGADPGSGTGTGPATQTLGVGGIATPAAGPNVVLITADRATKLTITTSNKVYDGGGRTVTGGIEIAADGVTVQNFRVNAQQQYGIYSSGTGNIIQNNDIKGLTPTGDGDLNAITFFGNDTKILFNTAIDFVSGSPGGSHTDFVQTWVSTSHPVNSSNVVIQGNKATGPANPTRSTSIASIHQCVMAEGFGRGGNTGGSTTNPHDWLIADNEFGGSWNQEIKLDGIDNVSVTRNRFVGSSDTVMSVTSASAGFKYYNDNVVTGTYGSLGATTIPGPGPGAIVTGGGGTPVVRPLVGWGGNDGQNVAGVNNELRGAFMARSTWTDLSAGNYLNDTPGLAAFITANPNAAVMIGVPLIPHDSTGASGWNALLDEAASGTRDSVYTALGAKLAAKTPRTCYARLWWEFNVNNESSINATKFKAAWARAVPLIRQGFNTAAPSKVLRIVFNSMPDRTTRDSHYPGSSVVDLVTYDVYGKTFGTTTATKTAALAEINGYLAALVAWGKSVGKPVGLDEWGNWQTKPADGTATNRGFGDWPEYITRVFDWATTAGNNVNHLCYFNEPGGDVGTTLAQQPNSLAVFTTRTKQVQSGTTTGTPTGGSDTGAVLIIKAPTGVNTITNNRLFETVALAGLTLSGGAYRRTGVGPQLVKLERADVGIAGDPNETDGTGLSITGVPGDIGTPIGGGTPTPGGGTGGGGGTGSADNPGDLLKVGLDSGFSKANIGVGFLKGDPLDRDGDGHVDFTLAEIGNGLVVPAHFEMTPDKQRVRLTVPASAGTTSANTANPRTEFRELKQAGDGSSSHPKAAWDPTKDDHKCFTRDRVIHAPSQKPQIVMIQTHDASDDTSMLRYHGGKLQCRIGDTVLSIGDITWNLNNDYDKGIQVTAGKVKFWFGPVGNPVVVYEGSFGWSTPQYFKWGCYLQANETNVDADEYGQTEMAACMCWHTGDPEPAVHLG